jgi:hypothetical protein
MLQIVMTSLATDTPCFMILWSPFVTSEQNEISFVIGKILLISSPILILDIRDWKEIPFLPGFVKKSRLLCGISYDVALFSGKRGYNSE